MVNTNYEVMTIAYKKMIAQYLAKRAMEDKYLAKALKKPGKTLDGVIGYVREKARMQASGGVACIPDDEVYGWAVHYILEDDLDSEKSSRWQTPPKTEEKKEEVKAEEIKKEVKAEPKKAAPAKKAKTLAEEVGEQLMLDLWS